MRPRADPCGRVACGRPRMSPSKSWSGARIYTVGHSTRSVDGLVALLRPLDVSVVADIRTLPRSRHNPQFNADALRAALRSRSIRYVHLGGLGGLRKPRQDSPNTAWRNASFRGYADYMQTPGFADSLARCIDLAKRERVALMCAESVPWRCHRSLIADALLARGIETSEITSAIRTRPHELTPWARVQGTQVTYPAPRSGRAAPPRRRRPRAARPGAAHPRSRRNG